MIDAVYLILVGAVSVLFVNVSEHLKSNETTLIICEAVNSKISMRVSDTVYTNVYINIEGGGGGAGWLTTMYITRVCASAGLPSP